MLRERLQSNGWVVIFGILAASSIISYAYLRMEMAGNALAEYESASLCSGGANCRIMIEATILERRQVHIVVKGFRTKSTSTPSAWDSTYLFVVSSELGQSTIEVSSNPPTVGTPFDMPNVYVPTDYDGDFVDMTFHVGKQVSIEVWRGQITLLSTNEIVDRQALMPHPFESFAPMETSIGPLPTIRQELVMPSTVHPLLVDASARYDFFWLSFFSAALAIATFSGTFRKK